MNYDRASRQVLYSAICLGAAFLTLIVAGTLNEALPYLPEHVYQDVNDMFWMMFGGSIALMILGTGFFVRHLVLDKADRKPIKVMPASHVVEVEDDEIMLQKQDDMLFEGLK